jgi:hypothetical protein
MLVYVEDFWTCSVLHTHTHTHTHTQTHTHTHHYYTHTHTGANVAEDRHELGTLFGI